MKSFKYIQALLIGALMVACSTETPETTATGEQPAASEEADFEVVEYLFVQHAESVTLEDGLLTLEGIGGEVLYFSDRPQRIVGRESVEWFVDAWDEGEESFAESPPNAVLAVKKEEELVDLTVVLKQPVLTDRTLVYSVEVLDGPESGGGDFAALFIDAFVKRLKGRAGRALKRGADRVGRGADRVGRFGGNLRGGEPGRPGEFGSAKRGGEAGRPGDFGSAKRGGEPGRPGEFGSAKRGAEPGRGRGEREVHRRGSRNGAEIR